MEMKKRVLTMLLTSALLTAPLTACNTVGNDDTITTTETTVETISNMDTLESITSNLQNEATSDDFSNQLLEKYSTQDIEETSTPKPDSSNSIPISVDFSNYDSIITMYRKIVELCLKYETISHDEYFIFSNDTARNWYAKIFQSTLLLYPHNADGLDGNSYEKFGYTVKDLNNDNVSELILRLDDHEVISIFTMVNEKPVLMDYYWNRKNCWIDPAGYLHVGGSNGADRSFLQIYRISNQTGELTLLEEGGTDGYDEASGGVFYYKLLSNEKIYITEEEYNNWKQSLPYANFEVTTNINEYMPFAPLFNENHPAPEPYVSPSKG